VVPGHPDQSLIVQQLRSAETHPEKGLDEVSLRPIKSAELEKVVQWIEQGAPEANQPAVEEAGHDPLISEADRQFWAFQPPKRSSVPSVKHRDLVRNPIDEFVLSKLEANGLSFSPEANRQTTLDYRQATGDSMT